MKKKLKSIIVRLTDEPLELIAWLVGTIIVSGIVFAVVENFSIWDGIWWAFTTAVTAGYGDIYPTTIFTRVLAIALIVMVFSVVVLLAGHMIMKGVKDDNAWTDEEQEQLKKDIKLIKKHLGIRE